MVGIASEAKISIVRFIGKFTVLHFVTYTLFGILFYSLSNYTSGFSSPGLSAIMRPTDSIWVITAPLFQLVRGPILAVALFPFRNVILNSRWGWFKLFGALIILTAVGAVATGVGSIEGMLYTQIPIADHFVGFPEVTLQMLAFSRLFVSWSKTVEKRFVYPIIAVFVVLVAMLSLGVLAS